MINEVHWFTKERFFTHSLLKNFFDNSYKYLALESLDEDADSLMQRGYPIISSGFYIKAPQMSNMIRTAIKLGFKLVKYDVFENNREYIQALNLHDQTLKIDSSAKVLVHAGGDHVNKCPETKKMAYYFQEISGIEPYVVRQTLQFNTIMAKYNGMAIIEENDMNCRNNMRTMTGLEDNDYRLNAFEEIAQVINLHSLVNQNKWIDDNEQRLLSFYIQEEYDKFSLKAIPVSNHIITITFQTKHCPYPKVIIL